MTYLLIALVVHFSLKAAIALGAIYTGHKRVLDKRDYLAGLIQHFILAVVILYALLNWT